MLLFFCLKTGRRKFYGAWVKMARLAIHESPDLQLESFADAVKNGLSLVHKCLPPRFFYDTYGSELFNKICELPEYYLTRTEATILEECFNDIAANDISTIIELGSGSANKTKLLFDKLETRSDITFVPIDISQDAIEESSFSILSEYDNINIQAHIAEYDKSFEAIREHSSSSSLILFLGSNIGNFTPSEAASFLTKLRQNLKGSCKILIGFDMQKDKEILHKAYNDYGGVTATFNRNLLDRINRELGGNFITSQFKHLAFYNETESRIEMYLASDREQDVTINEIDMSIHFKQDETIHTENSYKFSVAQIEKLASASGFSIEKIYTDNKKWFSVVLFKPL